MGKKLPDNGLLVVADGEGARLFHRHGTGNAARLAQTERWSAVELEHDGPAGKRPPESDQQATDEATFAKQLAHRLNRRALAGKMDALLLVADPQTLGQVRPLLHQQVHERLVGTLDKALATADSTEILRSLRAAGYL